jgi:lipoprotein-anchoring transpeptidase ErfK/SrfK
MNGIGEKSQRAARFRDTFGHAAWNLPVMSRITNNNSTAECVMAARDGFRRLCKVALYASLIVGPVMPAAAQSLAYQPADRGLAFPQYAPQAQQAEPATDELPAALRRQTVSYQGSEAAGTIIIDTAHTYLYLILGNGQAMRYGIGVGRDGFTWSGTQNITKKAEWPDWTPPPEMIARQPYLPRWVGGGPGNPLGARAMYLGNTDYRIHGTNDPTTIGKHVSSGCIRLQNADVIDLYSRVNVGTKVIVLPNDPRQAAVVGRQASIEQPVSIQGGHGMPMTAQIQVTPAAYEPAPAAPQARVTFLGIPIGTVN